MALRQCWVKVNPSFDVRKVRGRGPTTTPSPLRASLTVVTAFAAVAVTIVLVAVVLSVTSTAGRAALAPSTVGRPGAGTSTVSGRGSHTVLVASIARDIRHRRGGPPRLLAGGIRAVCCGCGRLGRGLATCSSSAGHALDQSRNLLKRHSLVGESLDQHDLLLRGRVQSGAARGPGTRGRPRGVRIGRRVARIWHRRWMGTALAEHLLQGEGQRGGIHRLRGDSVRRRCLCLRQQLMRHRRCHRLRQARCGQTVRRCGSWQSGVAGPGRGVLASHVSERLQDGGAVGSRGPCRDRRPVLESGQHSWRWAARRGGRSFCEKRPSQSRARSLPAHMPGKG